MNCLDFARSQTYSNERSDLVSSEPPIARYSLSRQRDMNRASMQALFQVMINGRSKVFKIASGTSIIAAPTSILAACLASYVSELHIPKEFVQTTNSLFELCRIGLLGPTVIKIDRKYVCDVDGFDVLRLPTRLIFRRYVFSEPLLRLCSFSRSASRGDMIEPVNDDPSRSPDELASLPFLWA